MQGTNPQFPHWIKVTRTIVNTDVNPPTSTTEVIHEGICRNQPSGVAGITDGAVISDCLILLPFNEIKFNIGDITEITDRVGVFYGEVVDSYNGNLGCKIWHNRVNN